MIAHFRFFATISHFTLYGTNNRTMNMSQCGLDETASTNVYGWAPGALPFALPSDLGLPLGPADFGVRSFILQIHYDNPDLLEGVLDSSGVRIYFVNQSRPISAGFVEMGDPGVALYDQPVGGGVREHSFECGAGCSSLALPDSGVTVLRSYLHMHRTGIQASIELIRNGTTIRKATAEFFDFAQQGAQLVQAEPFTVLPGDEFRVRCYYRNPPNSTVIFGDASSDEMCIATMLYYPRQLISDQIPWNCGYQLEEPCSATYSSRTLEDGGDLGRAFGNILLPNGPGIIQTDSAFSFNNSLQCPLVVSPSDEGSDTATSGALLLARSLVAALGVGGVVAFLL
jgi:Copper type II ascorbate-dependent monooxygenase, C-terminal domain/Copper type II ascorbate-dependent monooxygenase, N-terminal domain